MLRADKSLLLAKIETVYGEEPTPSKISNAILANNIKVEPIFKTTERLAVSPGGGKYPPIRLGEGVKITFDAELHPSPSAGTEPPLGPLFEACNLKKTASAGVSVTYSAEINLVTPSVTIWAYFDGIVHKVNGCVGTVKIDAMVKEIVKCSFEFTGLYSGPAGASMPTDPTFVTTTPYILKNASFALEAITDLVGTSVSLDLGNTVSMRESFNAASGTERYFVSNHEIKANIEPDAVAANNWWTAITGNTDYTLGFGLDGGDRDCAVSLENCFIDTTGYGDRNNILTHQLALTSRPKIGDTTYVPLTLIFT